MTGLADAEYVLGSVALGIEEYYLGVGEAPGVWSGAWASELGLAGMVEADDLRALLDGLHPGTGEALTAGTRARSLKAFDLTFSAPKSVSLLWALSTREVSDVVGAAHREAVAVAMGFLEGQAVVARHQVAGVRVQVATSGLVVAGFVHRTSREGDPQLHTHCLVPNLTRRRSDGRVVALDGTPIYQWARAAGSVYQAELQRTLALRLGVAWGPDRNGTRELAGFTTGQLRAFSKRTVQIEAELAATGRAFDDPALRMTAADQASLATRTAKDHGVTPVRLLRRWVDEAKVLRLEIGDRLTRQVCFTTAAPERPPLQELLAGLVDPDTGLCSRSARFDEADVIEHLCAASGGRLTLEEIRHTAATFLASHAAVRLQEPEIGSRAPQQWTTEAHLALELRVLTHLDHLQHRPTTPVIAEAVTRALDASPHLGVDQAAAVRVLCGRGGAVRVVLAPAGYGKTAMAHAAVTAATLDGHPVLAVATTAKAVGELQAVGLAGSTIAALRQDLALSPLAPGTVVLLDEVSQVATRDADAVLAAVTACPGGQLWVLGDPKQAQPVGPGGLAAELATRGQHGQVPIAELTVNRRQHDPVDRQALDLTRQGRTVEAQAVRTAAGWEHQPGGPETTRHAMAAAVTADLQRHGHDQVVALTVGHGDAEDLADRIRTHLTHAGHLTGPAITGPGWTRDRTYQAGDRILLHTRFGPRGSPLVNGTTATITATSPGGLTVTPDGAARPVLLPVEFVTGTRADGTPNLSHAWARTVDGAQGGTWHAAHLLGTPALDAYRGYTGQTRSRTPTHTWNTTPATDRDHGGRTADQRTAADHVATALARTPDPTFATTSRPGASALERLRAEVATAEQAAGGAAAALATLLRRLEAARTGPLLSRRRRETNSLAAQVPSARSAAAASEAAAERARSILAAADRSETLRRVNERIAEHAPRHLERTAWVPDRGEPAHRTTRPRSAPDQGHSIER